MRSSNVEGFVSTVPTLYEEVEEYEEDYVPLYRDRRMPSSIFTLHSSYHDTQRYATLNCSVKIILRAGGT